MLLKEIHENEWIHYYYRNDGRCPYCGRNLRLWWGCTDKYCQFSLESSKLTFAREKQYFHFMRFINFLSQKKHEHFQRLQIKMGQRLLTKKYVEKTPI
jgi:hypothetical protein